MIGIAQGVYDFFQAKPKPTKVPGSLFWQNENFGITGVNFDLLINETRGVEFDVSEHQIENGDTIADNVRRHLKRVTITGLFTNHGLNENTDKWFNSDGSFNAGSDKIELEGQEITINYALLMYNKLEEIANAKKPIKLTAALEVYENMIITSLRTARGPNDGEAVRFEMELREMKTAGSITTQYEDATWTPKEQNSPEARAAAATSNGGNISGQDKDAAEMGAEIAGVNNGEWGF